MQFLPRRFSSTGSYSDQQYTAASAFRILFHAELESFFEELALDILENILKNISNNKPCHGSAAIVSLFNPEKMHGFPMQKNEMQAVSFLKRTQLACAHDLRRKIEANRGAKTYNVLSMFLPLGIDETLIEEQLLIDLNTLAAKRGDVAHNGIHAVTSLPDPKEEKELAERIIASLCNFQNLTKG